MIVASCPVIANIAAGGGKPNYAVDVYLEPEREVWLTETLPGVILLKDVQINALVCRILIQGFSDDVAV